MWDGAIDCLVPTLRQRKGDKWGTLSALASSWVGHPVRMGVGCRRGPGGRPGELHGSAALAGAVPLPNWTLPSCRSSALSSEFGHLLVAAFKV